MSMQPSATHATAVVRSPNHSRPGETGTETVFPLVAMIRRLKMGNDVKQHDDEYPHYIDEVPVARNRLIRLVRCPESWSITRQDSDVSKEQETGYDVRPMQCGDGVEDGAVRIAGD